ncbi:hypothetical protein OG423_32185 [Micromonospora zamorensis]|uniref:hypothetical protein n=1 Tax=Micromonospora zamorensis TaxID=709883 RepID=UPI00352A9153|nr:hypothetical protein OG423_32185 [Micromonospora zamorensis]
MADTATATKTRRTRTAPAAKAAPAAAETPAGTAAAALKAHTPKASTKAATAQPQPPSQPVEAKADEKKTVTPRLAQADLVLAFLAAHPDEDFGPQAVSKAITPEGRKPLGVRDCLARLAKADKVTVTSEKPLRYRITAAV